MKVKQRSAYYYQLQDGREPARDWLLSHPDSIVVSRILLRIQRIETGNFGDFKNVGRGVYELRLNFGPGFRVYFGLNENKELIVLLIAGTKASQARDIKLAEIYWKDYKAREQL